METTAPSALPLKVGRKMHATFGMKTMKGSRSTPVLGEKGLSGGRLIPRDRRPAARDNEGKEGSPSEGLKRERSVSSTGSSPKARVSTGSPLLGSSRRGSLFGALPISMPPRATEAVKESTTPEAPPQQQQQRRQTHVKYNNLVAKKGHELFRQLTGGGSSSSSTPGRKSTNNGEASSPPSPNSAERQSGAKRLVATPSMVMLNEAAEVLSQSPSALTPMEVESTGGVYQLRRQANSSLLETPDSTTGLTRQKSVYGSSDGKGVSTLLNSSFSSTLSSGRRPRFFNSKKGQAPPKQQQQQQQQQQPPPPQSNGGGILRSQTFGHSQVDIARTGSSLFIDAHSTLTRTTTTTGGSKPLLSYKTDMVKGVRFSDEPSSAKSTGAVPSTSGPVSALPLRRTQSQDPNPRRTKPQQRPSSASRQQQRQQQQQQQQQQQGQMLKNSSSSGLSAGARLKRKYASKVAVFKPEDEETGASAQLRMGDINPERAGLVIGGGARRERAAYLLDKNVGRFSGVPETVLVCSELDLSKATDKHMKNTAAATTLSTSHSAPANGAPSGVVRKRGSLQRFCESDGCAEDRPDLVRLATPKQVHALGILDLRTFNTDRIGTNILCKKISEKSVKLIPIDAGLILPNFHYLSEPYFDWGRWAQAEVPFDEETKKVIDGIDIEKDAQVLRELGIPEGCIATLKICTYALKVGAKHNLTLKDLAKVFERPFCVGHDMHNKYFSPLEQMLVEAHKQVNLEYHPAGSLEKDVYALGASFQYAQVEQDGEEVDIGLREQKAFANDPPPEDFYRAFEEVLEAKFAPGLWRELIPF